jgi:hypothetical protein
MWRNSLCASGAVALVLVGVSDAGAVSVGSSKPAGLDAIIQRVHSVYEAEETLYRRGYYDIRLERATIPYSFNACKRGIRFHVHVGYYGELVERDALGPCERDDGFYRQRRYPERPRYWRGY